MDAAFNKRGPFQKMKLFARAVEPLRARPRATQPSPLPRTKLSTTIPVEDQCMMRLQIEFDGFSISVLRSRKRWVTTRRRGIRQGRVGFALELLRTKRQRIGRSRRHCWIALHVNPVGKASPRMRTALTCPKPMIRPYARCETGRHHFHRPRLPRFLQPGSYNRRRARCESICRDPPAGDEA